MTTKTYTVEVRVDVQSAEQDKCNLQIMKEMARTALTRTALISPGRKPQVALMVSDFFGTNEDLKIHDDESVDELEDAL